MKQEKTYRVQETERKKIILCEHCIEAIRSHGEKVSVNCRIDQNEIDICKWCDEPEENLYECEFR